MKLPFSFPFGKKQEAQYFLALLLEDEAVTAVIFEEENRKLSVVASAKDYFQKLLDESSFEQTLDVIDKAVSKSEVKIPQDAKLSKTIFAVKSQWTEDGKIKKEHGIILKKICSELALEPIGFLVFAEAILHLLQQKEGAPVSAILVEVGKTQCCVSLVRAGRIVETKQVPLEEHLPKTVDTALKNFENLEILPARIILFDGENNESLSQSFIRYSWSKTLPFLHVPAVTILPPHFDIRAVLSGTATQMGFSISDRELPEVLEEEKVFEEISPEEEAPEIEEDTPKLDVIEDDIPLEEAVPAISKDDDIVEADYFGFVKNQDVAATALKMHSQMTAKQKKEVDLLPEEVINEEIEEIPEKIKEEMTHEYKRDSLVAENRLLFKSTLDGIKKLISGFHLQDFIDRTKKMIEGMLTRSEKSSPVTTKKNSPLGFIVIVIAVVLVLCIAVVSLYIFGLKAMVTLGVSPQVAEDSAPITLSVDGTTDVSSNTLSSHAVSVDEKGSASVDVTGTKDIGTPAKGQVTIFSRLSDTTTLPKGTTVVAPNGLKFTLDSETTIASFSGGPDDPSTTVTGVSVTASDIGTQYNMPSGTKFSVSGEDKSDVSAKNDNAFSGGTKSTVSIVSQKDIDNLTDAVKKSLEDQARTDLAKNVSADSTIMSGFSGENVGTQKTSKNIGDQAKNITIDATVTYQSQVYSKNDLMNLSKKLLKDKVSNNTDFSQNSIKTNVSNVQQKDDKTITATLSVKALLLPVYDNNRLTHDIAGKSFTNVTTILKNLPQVTDATITLRPAIPFLPKVLPRLPQNISVVVKSDE